MGTIKVMGQGDMKFAPDVTRVSVDIDALHTTYQEAFEAGAKNTNYIKDILAEHGLDRDLAKTSRFDVNMHRVHKKVERGEWQWIVRGTKSGRHSLSNLRWVARSSHHSLTRLEERWRALRSS